MKQANCCFPCMCECWSFHGPYTTMKNSLTVVPDLAFFLPHLQCGNEVDLAGKAAMESISLPALISDLAGPSYQSSRKW